MSNWKTEEIKKLLRKVHFYCIPTSAGRMKFIKKHEIFAECGENVFFQPRKLPSDPKYIRFHNNIAIAADVTFVTHDVIHLMLRNLEPGNDRQHMGCIEIMDNVFIGLGSIISPNVRIGSNVVVAAGSVVTKDIPPNTVVAGVPAKPIGSFEKLVEKRKQEIRDLEIWSSKYPKQERWWIEWRKFTLARDNCGENNEE